MRTIVAAGLSFTTAVVSVALAQPPPLQKTPPSPKPQTVTVRGCISGRSIVELQPGGLSVAATDSNVGSSFRLRGSKSMMKAIEEHNGHGDEIAGVVKLSQEGTADVIGEKRKGKARVYAGKRTGGNTGNEARDAGEIEVKTLTHLNDRCR